MSGHGACMGHGWLEVRWLENTVWDAPDDLRIVLHGEGS